MTQTAMTLWFGTAQDAQVPSLGASGAIAAVLGAYWVLYPGVLVTRLLVRAGQATPQARYAGSPLP